jgi:polyisoprenoid-binding protein YceI
MRTGTKTEMASVTFAVDKAVSRFNVQAFASGLLSAFGHSPRVEIRDYQAEVQCVPRTLEDASLRVIIQTGRMEVLDEMKRDDLKKLEQEMYERVLDTRNFPTAVYTSHEINVRKITDGLFEVDVRGELSFHGVTQPQGLQGKVTVMGDNLRVAGGFSLLQSNYGIKPASFAAGTLRLKDELKFTFDLVARSRESSGQS